jgi:hypothetical protein
MFRVQSIFLYKATFENITENLKKWECHWDTVIGSRVYFHIRKLFRKSWKISQKNKNKTEMVLMMLGHYCQGPEYISI